MLGVEASPYTYISCCKLWPRLPTRTCHARSSTACRVHCLKPTDYQDCQGYARPSRLLPITEAEVRTESSLEQMFTSLRVSESRSVYIVKLQTSTAFGSCLSDLDAGILLCLIDENGDSVLLRLSATPLMHPLVNETGVSDLLRFQRGSVDEFIFEGPKLGRIQALWVGLESGHWRFGGVSLTVINGCRGPSGHSEEVDEKVNSNSGLRYDFETEDIMFGGSGDISMVELRPCHITELSGADLLPSSNMGSQSRSPLDLEKFNKESMREYADLKSSLLIYDSMLILAGTSITAISSGEKAALAFLIGGAGGFLYLLLLQKSVDRLPAPALSALTKEEEKLNQLSERIKRPIWSLALVFLFVGVGLKYGSGATPVELTAQEILVGMAGFLSCKIAVLLAAFSPIPIKLKDIN